MHIFRKKKEEKEIDGIKDLKKSLLVSTLLGSLILVIIIWLLILFLIPPIKGMELPLSRLFFALGCISIAVMLAFFLGDEAVAHERFFSKAFNPLLGYETTRLKVNLRYLQNTLEQLLIFIPGTLLLSFYLDNGASMRAILAITVVWILTRFAFWVGYHQGSRFRLYGIIGMFQSILVLMYGVARFSFDFFGVTGLILIFLIFFGIEGYLFSVMKRPGRG
ncbi:MAG TPA: MAPEG family protein [Candidatus Paceibacterota bacterium]|nr:MAPEG family protein [Candidatus Paceibacterota bacterium]